MPRKVLEHTADYMVEVRGASVDELFVEAASALFLDVLTENATILPAESRRVEVSAEDVDGLLVAWLSELLFLYESERWLVSRVEILKRDATSMDAIVFGEPFDPARHVIEREVKAVTYHQLGVVKEGGEYRTRIVFDL